MSKLKSEGTPIFAGAKLPQRKILSIKKPPTKPPRQWLTPQETEIVYLFVNETSPREIADQLGIEIKQVRTVLNSERVQNVLSEYWNMMDLEMRTMQKSVVESMKKAFKHPDPSINLKAVNLWARMHGKFEQTINVNLSAEDIVRQIMERRAKQIAD